MPIVFVEPCVPVSRPSPPKGSGWIHEAKFDGWRVQIVKADGAVRIFSRRGYDLTRRLPRLSATLLAVPGDVVIDGELVLR